jgi:hypothetical protein
MENQIYKITLELTNSVKGIPYSDVKRENSTNHGFKALKGVSVEEISQIPEADFA